MKLNFVHKVKSTLLLAAIFLFISGLTGVVGFTLLILFNVSLAWSFPIMSILIAIPFVYGGQDEQNEKDW